MTKKNIILITINLLIFVTIMILVILNLTQAIDIAIYNIMSKIINSTLTWYILWITVFGNEATVICIIAFLIYILRKNKLYWIPVLATILFSSGINYLIKAIIERPRPDILRLIEQGGYSFPSGHSQNNMAIYFLLFLLINHYMKKSKKKTILSVITIALPILIGLSRIYVGVHYPSDVLAGWILGGTIAYIIFLISLKFKEKPSI